MSLNLVVWHVGGDEGGYGPAGRIVDRYPDNSTLVLFEARANAREFRVARETDGRRLILNRCVGDRSALVKFYCYEFGAASSLLPINDERYGAEFTGHPTIRTWGEHAKLSEVVDVEMCSVDLLVEEHGLPCPDLLSLDAQGAELQIFQGAVATLPQILAVVSEYQTLEVYRGQALFHDQCKFLLDRGFRLADLISAQYWHPSEPAGEGFLTAGDALFLRQLGDGLPFDKLVKLATLSLCFNRLSFAFLIFDLLLERHPGEFEQYREHVFLRELRQARDQAKSDGVEVVLGEAKLGRGIQPKAAPLSEKSAKETEAKGGGASLLSRLFAHRRSQ